MIGSVLRLVVGLALALALARPAVALEQGPFADVPPNHPAADAVNELAKQGFVNGYADNLYHGDRLMTRYEVAMAVMRLMQEPLQRNPGPHFWPIKPIPGPPLTDVPEGHWAADAVARLREWGIIGGYPDATFRGDRVMTQGELAVIVQRVREFAYRLMDLEMERQRKESAPASSPPGTAPGAPSGPGGRPGSAHGDRERSE